MKVTQASISESVTQHLARRIIHGDLAPGLSLSGENELAQEYDVSRTSVRNALQVLAAKGLISIQAKKRSTVNSREQWSLLDIDVLGWLSEGEVDLQLVEQLMITRLIFEPNVATLAALNANGHDLAAMEDALQLMRQGQLEAERPLFEQGDMAFHQALLRATHNPFLLALGNALSAAMELSFRQTIEKDVRQTKTAIDEHFQLFDAIRLKQVDNARQQMRSIVLNAAKKRIWHDRPEMFDHII
ncbi:FadR family transcriptional regulator [Enterobacteriaceae bacterium H11S18]|uniref:FadR/GntR family transcriptional regulator n=1 Tax=Dryocola clanedunensis TaxID=2925396 RepID=UPI0022F0F76A|nr:FadR/GntR family transcriptional regulator [Dryocola clanedunensis]MCT4711085.1 FadR family transcriptional regulator [Dryocola clanedunensis]